VRARRVREQREFEQRLARYRVARARVEMQLQERDDPELRKLLDEMLESLEQLIALIGL